MNQRGVKEDCSVFVDQVLEQIKDRPTQVATDVLLEAEKETRKKQDAESTTKIVLELLRLDLKENRREVMREHLKEFCLKKGQMKQTIKEMVSMAVAAVDQITELDEKEKLLLEIKEITHGRIFVELERVRASKLLSEIMEKKGQLKEAADEVFDIPIETFGSIAKEEKIDFLLKQLELALKTKDYTRMKQTSTKITPKTFEGGYLPEKRILFLIFFVVLMTKEKKYHQAADACVELLKISGLSSSDREDVLKNCVWFLILSNYLNREKKFLNKIAEERQLEGSPYKQIVSDLIENRLISPKNTEVFFEEKEVFLSFVPSLCLNEKEAMTKEAWGVFQEKIVEHNIQVISKHYSTIYLSSLSSYLELSEERTEEIICRMILENKDFNASIDRPLRIVCFYSERDTTQLSENIQMIVERLAKIKRSTSAA